MFSYFLSPIHKEGYKYVFLFIILSIAGFAYSWSVGVCGLLITGMISYFFRNPDRSIPDGYESLILSPADGVVADISQYASIDNPDVNCVRITILLSIMNVHINRMPTSGRITRAKHFPGLKSFPSGSGPSDANERMEVTIESKIGNHSISVVQIAGKLARRIVCYVDEDDEVDGGAVFGLIKFSSRVDLYLPLDITPSIRIGQTMVAGETVIAKIPDYSAQAQSTEPEAA